MYVCMCYIYYLYKFALIESWRYNTNFALTFLYLPVIYSYTYLIS